MNIFHSSLSCIVFLISSQARRHWISSVGSEYSSLNIRRSSIVETNGGDFDSS